MEENGHHCTHPKVWILMEINRRNDVLCRNSSTGAEVRVINAEDEEEVDDGHTHTDADHQDGRTGSS